MAEKQDEFSIDEQGWRPNVDPAVSAEADKHRKTLDSLMETAGVAVVSVDEPNLELPATP